MQWMKTNYMHINISACGLKTSKQIALRCRSGVLWSKQKTYRTQSSYTFGNEDFGERRRQRYLCSCCWQSIDRDTTNKACFQGLGRIIIRKRLRTISKQCAFYQWRSNDLYSGKGEVRLTVIVDKDNNTNYLSTITHICHNIFLKRVS